MSVLINLLKFVFGWLRILRFDARNERADSVTRIFNTDLIPILREIGKKEGHVLLATRACDIVTLLPAAGRAVAMPVTGLVGSCPGGAGSIGVVVKISHRLGNQTKRSYNPPLEPKEVLGLDGVGHTPLRP